MTFEVLEGRGAPKALAAEWESLLARSRFQNPFLTPLWNEIWTAHFGKSLDVKILLLRNPGRALLALGAFADPPAAAGKGLTLAGSDEVSDYRDLILAADQEEEILRALARFFAAGPWDFLELKGISEFSPTARILPPVLRSAGLPVVQEVEEVATHLRLPATWEEFLEGLSSKDRHELRRKLRRLEKETAFEVIGTRHPAALERELEAFFSLHRKSRREKESFMSPQMEAFFRELARRFAERGWLNLSFLKAGGREIAAYFNFQFRGTEFVFNSGYDPEYSRLSPGIVLAAHDIRRTIEENFQCFNFLRGHEDYKYRLGVREEKIYRIRVEKG